GPAVLEDRQVDDGDADAVGQLGQGHPALVEQGIQPDADRGGIVRPAGLVVSGGRIVAAACHTVPLISSSSSVPSRMIRAKVSSAAPVSTGTGTSARSGPKIMLTNGCGSLAMVTSSSSTANSWTSAATRLPARMNQPSRRIPLATLGVNGPS